MWLKILFVYMTFAPTLGQHGTQKFQSVLVWKNWWTGVPKETIKAPSETLCAIQARVSNEDKPFQFKLGECLMLNSDKNEYPVQEYDGSLNGAKLFVTVERVHNGNKCKIKNIYIKKLKIEIEKIKIKVSSPLGNNQSIAPNKFSQLHMPFQFQVVSHSY